MAPSVAKAVSKMTVAAQRQVVKKMDALQNDPRPHGFIQLKGKSGAIYRVRTGNYRIVYKIEDALLVVLVVEVADRKEVASY